ncbi:MAG: transglycosylase domain-containing protein [Bacteroidales bacterium]|nr:transglycosylase domain-containing protein [Bacteroidales bacterium]
MDDSEEQQTVQQVTAKQRIIKILKLLYFPSDNSRWYFRWLINAGKVLGHCIFLISLLVLLVYAGAFGALPTEADLLAISNSNASEIYSADSKLIGRIYLENRVSVDSSAISKNVINALVATEDSRFFEHHGVDFMSIGRVLVRSVLMFDKNQGGGSTISQQLAKNLFPRRRFGFLTFPVAKIKEIFIAQRIENMYNKEDILTLYLNTVPFGENVYGIEAAAQRFFGKKAKQLTVNEAATLVGLLAANTAYNPRLHPELSQTRRNVVLERMSRAGFLDSAQLATLKNEPIELNYNKIDNESGLAVFFRQKITDEAQSILNQLYGEGEYDVFTDGLTINTTIDSRLQEYAEAAVSEHLTDVQTNFDKQWQSADAWTEIEPIYRSAYEKSERYRKMIEAGFAAAKADSAMNDTVDMTVFTAKGSENVRQTPADSVRQALTTLNAGFVAYDPHNGDILAWVGGINYQLSQTDHVTIRRQVGSTFKPIVYAAALENGIRPDTYVENVRRSYAKSWSPANSDGKYGGFYSLKGALSKSLNTVSAWLINEVGTDAVTAVARKLDIKSDIPQVPSIALGTAELTLGEMTRAYEAFATCGVVREPTAIVSIKDAKGEILYNAVRDVSGYQAIDSIAAVYVNDMMKAVVDSGTARSLRSVYGLKGNLIGKTGTTQNSADGWFIGATPNIVVGAWVGCDVPAVRFKSSRYGQGAYMALPIVGKFLSKVSKSKSSKFAEGEFPPPLNDEMSVVMSFPLYSETEPDVDALYREAEFERFFAPDDTDDNGYGRRRRPIKDFFNFMRELFRDNN